MRRGGEVCNLLAMPTLDDVIAKLDRIELRQVQQTALLSALVTGETIMSQQLDTLTEQVTQVETVEQSAVTLIKGLADQLKQIANDPAAIQALADRLHASSDVLAAAVTANTPTP